MEYLNIFLPCGQFVDGVLSKGRVSVALEKMQMRKVQFFSGKELNLFTELCRYRLLAQHNIQVAVSDTT